MSLPAVKFWWRRRQAARYPMANVDPLRDMPQNNNVHLDRTVAHQLLPLQPLTQGSFSVRRASVSTNGWEDRLYSDVVLIGSGHEPVPIKAHRFILSTSSGYFRTLFRTQLPTADGTHVLRNIEHETLKEIINYMYGG